MSTTDDERRLAELGYKQELARSWSGFSNFAISFTIVSILTGGLASYGIGLANGGPITMAWGWPLVPRPGAPWGSNITRGGRPPWPTTSRAGGGAAATRTALASGCG